MRKLLLLSGAHVLAGCFVSLAQLPPGGADHSLATTRQVAKIQAKPIYARLPLTVECWVKLDSRKTYNILIANEPKSSATHWELFTPPSGGELTVYLPGCRPDHVRTEQNIADSKWHHVALVLESDRVRLLVDGIQKADQRLTRPLQASVAGPLVIGALDSGDLGCEGMIHSVRLSKSIRSITGIPSQPFEADDQTIGLWRFAQSTGRAVADLSALRSDAVLHDNPNADREAGIWPRTMHGGMSTALQPMPPPEDISMARQSLEAAARDLRLTTVSPAPLRDGVLRYWLTEYHAWRSNLFQPGQLEYPKSRPQTWADAKQVAEQACDKNALVWESDGGPLGTVLRRTAALLDCLQSSNPHLKLSEAAADLTAIRKRLASSGTQRDASNNIALYLAACAVRREAALRNPLLDFDSILCVARGTFEGSARSNPSTSDVQGGHFVTQYFGFNALPGGGFFVLRNFKNQPVLVNILEQAVVQNGAMKGRKLDHGAFATPDLSFDGRQVVFAWTANPEHKWVYSRKTVFHLFKVNADGTDLVQLTDGDVNDFDPCWLPNGRLAFVSERRGGYIRCFGDFQVRTYTLFSMASDGSDLAPLSYYETSEWNPTVNNDGNLVFTRWDYTDRENCLGSRIWISGPDGADPRAPHGNYPQPYHTFPDHSPWKTINGRETDSRRGTPLVEMGIRAIPGSARYVFTAAPHHGQVYGSICLLDLNIPDDGHMSQVRRFTPDEPFPESEMDNRRHYKYGTPWPLSEDFLICNAWENLVLVDRFGNKELLCETALLPCPQDERLRIIDPIPFRARSKPPVVPNRVPPRSATNTIQPATIATANVYESDLPFPPGTKIKWLRVTQNILKENHLMGVPMIGYERENTPRIPLGLVPVEEDGSVHFSAPVAKELIFQVLDENYMAVQSMRSTAFVHPGERLVCRGCHEKTHLTPPPLPSPAAFQRAPSRLQPELARLEPISYYRQIKPIVEKSCVPCHTKEGKGPKDMSYEALRNDVFWFSGAMWTDMCGPYSGIHGGSRTIPGRFGARYCRLGRALLTEAHQKAVSAEDRHAMILWLDSNSPRLGAYQDEAAQLRGELVWPVLDVDRLNPLGAEGRSPGLRHNFWHENGYGPYACLITEHQNDRVALLDEKGTVVWEYALPHPQDAWMLPSGNVLTTWSQGVREVTPDKRVVWEYTTTKPNEIPNCQPLPDGNVLIGIVGECRLIEVNRKGKIVHQVQLSTTEKAPHAQFRMCRKTPEGTYLVPFTAEGAVREYDPQGRVLREFPHLPSPVAALRLSNGNTLISAGGAVTEYDRQDNIVWRIGAEWLPDIQFGVLAGLQRLPNGNTIVCNWNTRDSGDKAGAHVFEVTPDKRIVWQIAGTHIGQVAQCQVLTPDFKLRADSPVR